MKNLKLLLLLVLLSVSTQSFSQDQLSSPDNVTPQYLENIFKNAYIDVLEVKDTFVKIKDNRTLYLDIDSQKRFISISILYTLKEGAKKDEILEVFKRLIKMY